MKSDNRIPLVQNGDIDAFVATATITPARMKTIDFSSVYYRAGQSLLVKKNSPIKSYKDLDGKGVCSVQGSTPEQTIRRLVPKANVVTFETYPECLTALRGGRVDAVTTDNVILGGYEAQDPSQLQLVGGLFTFEPYGIGIRKGNASLTKAINDTLADLKEERRVRQAAREVAGQEVAAGLQRVVWDGCRNGRGAVRQPEARLNTPWSGRSWARTLDCSPGACW